MATALDVERQARVTDLDRWLAEIAAGVWDSMTIGVAQDVFTDRVLPEVLPALIEAQATAAETGAAYVNAVARQSGGTAARVNPSMFTGVASDGRDLVSLLSQPLIGVYVAHAAGATPAESLAAGSHMLDRILTTQVHDAARAAESVSITATRQMTGHVRVVEPGACSRCIVLAGRYYRWSDGFLRHPQCRCSMRPTGDSIPDGMDDPQAIFDGMSTERQDAIFGQAGAQAIRDGADIGQVVNARRGMQTAAGDMKYTLEGTTRRGVGYRSMVEQHGAARAAVAERDEINRQVRNARRREESGTAVDWSQIQIAPKRTMPARLMPEQIYKVTDSRDDAVRLLRTYGYLR